ncbi:uncharacterized protein M421DRAFT_213913 [Didymella exigua CBS 183.55]|uniref:Uncharacterized protein n=1 Tax=Didymella exigua CBS 183.55 TaxID=1150837 RepID=A0A6A5RMC3_9PLEO|nr:uncharacterized protein M421DRAFT_213913 [Didymella exigua CBS 183.55]KAF1926687.1 hypothetical protein M421DRAFT_213913 [Didymella exigua CBS 183.55]
MAISTTFVLGQKESYFFNSPTHWAWHNLPADVEALFTKTPPIRDVIELALGPNQTYFVSYRDHDGAVACKHYNLPNPLVEYLYASHPTVIRDLATLSIAIGPYESYYAWDRTSASWSNVPPRLEKALLGRLESQDEWRTLWRADGYEAPCFVSLGSDGAYFMRTVSGGGCWDFKLPKVDARSGLGTAGGDGWEGIRGTNKFLEDSSNFTGIAAVHLMPTQANAYVLVLTNGTTFSNLPEHTWADYAKMADKLPAFVQHMTPLPPMPAPQPQPPHAQQPQAQQPQQSQSLPPAYKQSQRGASGCCASSALNAPHTCCAPSPMQARPWPLPPIAPRS